MSTQLAPELLEIVDFNAAAHAPFTSAAILEEGQAFSRNSSTNYHESTPEDSLSHSAQLENRLMIKVTIWRLLNTIVVLGLGIYKAVTAYLGQQTAPTTLDWVIGALWAVIAYWVSFLEEAQLGPRGRWFFIQDHSGAVLSILTGRVTPEFSEASGNLLRPKSGGDSERYRTRLNNTVQAYGWTVSYEISWIGPDNSRRWTAIGYVNNVQCGRGNGRTKGSAKENAAKEVLVGMGILRA